MSPPSHSHNSFLFILSEFKWVKNINSQIPTLFWRIKDTFNILLQNTQKYNPEFLCYQSLIVIKLLDKEQFDFVHLSKLRKNFL